MSSGTGGAMRRTFTCVMCEKSKFIKGSWHLSSLHGFPDFHGQICAKCYDDVYCATKPINWKQDIREYIPSHPRRFKNRQLKWKVKQLIKEL